MQLSMGIFYNGHQTNTVILGEEYGSSQFLVYGDYLVY